MAKIKILFQGTERSQTELNELEVFANIHNEIVVNLDSYNQELSQICLDKATAIRLVRELKKQIGIIMESEVDNG